MKSDLFICVLTGLLLITQARGIELDAFGRVKKVDTSREYQEFQQKPTLLNHVQGIVKEIFKSNEQAQEASGLMFDYYDTLRSYLIRSRFDLLGLSSQLTDLREQLDNISTIVENVSPCKELFQQLAATRKYFDTLSAAIEDLERHEALNDTVFIFAPRYQG